MFFGAKRHNNLTDKYLSRIVKDHLPVGLCYIDQQGMLYFASDAIFDILQLPAEMREEKIPFVEILRFLDKQGNLNSTHSTLSEKERVNAILSSDYGVYERDRSDGEKIQVEIIPLP